jgi:hypothetical protein
MSLRGDDIGGFWSTGIWVGLRILLVPSIVFAGFVFFQNSSASALPQINSLMGFANSSTLSSASSTSSTTASGGFDAFKAALGQLNGSLGGASSSHNDYFKITKGAKWVRP